LLDGALTIFVEARERGAGATEAAFALTTGAVFSAVFTTAEYVDWLSSSADAEAGATLEVAGAEGFFIPAGLGFAAGAAGGTIEGAATDTELPVFASVATTLAEGADVDRGAEGAAADDEWDGAAVVEAPLSPSASTGLWRFALASSLCRVSSASSLSRISRYRVPSIVKC